MKKEEKQKNKIDKTKLVGRIFAGALLVLMVFSVCVPLLFQLIQR